MKTRIHIFILFCIFIIDGNRTICAQPDSVRHQVSHDISITRPVVQVTGISIHDPGTRANVVDSSDLSRYSGGSMTDLLSSGGVFLKNYGNGALATMSLHGAGASQTSVLWNGIDLRSTTNGTADLSLLPVFLFDNISINTGASVNAIGGSLIMNTHHRLEEGFSERIVSNAGSFGEMKNGAELCFRENNFNIGVRGFQQHFDNNFTFTNIAQPGQPADTLQHANYDSRGMLADISWLSGADPYKNAQHLFTLYTWYNWSERKIAPTMFETNSESSQQDEFFRAVLAYNAWYQWFEMEAHAALLTEFMDFEVGFGQPSSFTHSMSLQNMLKLFRHFDKFYAEIKADQQHTTANVTQYLPATSQDRFQFAGDFRYYFGNKLSVGAIVRDEALQNDFQPVTASLGATYIPDSLVTLRVSVARNYRLPTFNDLYWTPGGNPSLKPEDSRNLDGGIDLNFVKGHWKFFYSISGYYRYTYNWIQWQPGPGYWEPRNLYEVMSYGVDHSLQIQYRKEKYGIKLVAALNYVRAENVRSGIPDDQSIGKQLMYLPAYTSLGKLIFNYGKWYGEWATGFTGLRFITTDHSSWLPSYTVHSITMGKRVDLTENYIDIFFRCDNLGNEQYQSVAWRPMPGRSIHVGVSMRFHQNIKSKTNE